MHNDTPVHPRRCLCEPCRRRKLAESEAKLSESEVRGKALRATLRGNAAGARTPNDSPPKGTRAVQPQAGGEA